MILIWMLRHATSNVSLTMFIIQRSVCDCNYQFSLDSFR